MSETLKRLREANHERANEAFFPVTTWSPMQWGCAVAGEAGELCNLLKKYERNRVPGDSQNVGPIAEEVADVVIYLDLLCQLLGIDMEQAIADKFDKTSAKIGSSVKFRV